jgi:hypothetical protein
MRSITRPHRRAMHRRDITHQIWCMGLIHRFSRPLGTAGTPQPSPVTGLLIAQDDQILFEHYQYGRTDRDRLISQSMAKSIIAMLVGIAIGHIAGRRERNCSPA